MRVNTALARSFPDEITRKLDTEQKAPTRTVSVPANDFTKQPPTPMVWRSRRQVNSSAAQIGKFWKSCRFCPPTTKILSLDHPARCSREQGLASDRPDEYPRRMDHLNALREKIRRLRAEIADI